MKIRNYKKILFISDTEWSFWAQKTIKHAFSFRYLPFLHLKFMRRKEEKILRVGRKMNSIHPSRNKRTSNYSRNGKLGTIRQAKNRFCYFHTAAVAPTSSISFYILVFLCSFLSRWMNGRCILQDLNYTFKVIVVCVLNCKIPSI